MGKIIQYRPAYVTGFENEVVEFSTLDELFNIGWVDNFRKILGEKPNPDFYRFSISEHGDHKDQRYTLMTEYKDGYEWWVVGYLNESNVIKELPIWEAKYK